MCHNLLMLSLKKAATCVLEHCRRSLPHWEVNCHYRLRSTETILKSVLKTSNSVAVSSINI